MSRRVTPLLARQVAAEECEVNALHAVLEARSALSLAIDKDESAASTSHHERQLIVISATAPLSTAIDVLTSNRILSAPVIRSDSTCAGVVDMASIVSFLVHCEKCAGLTPRQPNAHVQHAANITLMEVISQSTEYLFPFFQYNPLNVLLDVFGSGVHRVTLISEAYELIAPCSQSDMIRLLNEYCQNGMFPSLAAKTIESLGLGDQKITSADKTCTLRAVLQILADEHVSSVAIIDSDSGALVGEFSPSALRGLRNFDMLETDLVSYLAQERPAALNPKHVHLQDTFGDVLALLAEGRSHRVWILDEILRPVYVLTATDVLRLLGTGREVSAREANGDVHVHTLWKLLHVKPTDLLELYPPVDGN